MSDKLNLNKFVIFLLAVMAFGSGCVLSGDKNIRFINTEIICPDGIKIMVKFAIASDVKQAIITNYNDKKKNKTTENYTVIRLRDGRSVRIEKISPEKMLQCSLNEERNGVLDPKYIYYVN